MTPGQQAQPAQPAAPVKQEITEYDVINAFQALSQVKGPDVILNQILPKYGLQGLSQAKPEQYPGLIQEAKNAMAGLVQ